MQLLGVRLQGHRPCQQRRGSCIVPFATASVPRRSRPPPGRPRRDHQQAAPTQSTNNGDRPKRNKLDTWKNQLARQASNPRAVAVAQLLRIEEDGAFVGLVGGSPGGSSDSGGGPTPGVDAAPDASQDDMLAGRGWRDKLSDRDARLVTELVAGVTRWRRRLDYVIGRLTKAEDGSGLDPPLRQILRIGLYELLELGAPPHVINEHVQLAKRVMSTGAGGFANGVLRNATRLIESHQLPAPPAPGKDADPRLIADALGIATSHPTWLVARWLRQLGPRQTVALLKWNNSRPAHCLRVCPELGASPAQLSAKLLGQGVAAQPSTFLPHEFLKVESGLQALLASGMVAAGDVQVQDEAAGMVVAMLGPQPGELLLDACAAPGGKTLFAAARMRGKGQILAVDVSPARLQALAANAERQGLGGMVVTHAADLRSLARGPQQRQPEAQGSAAAGAEALLQARFDRVLLDAPCSGTGVLAKRADLRWRRQPADLQQLARLQDALLEAAAAWVKPGGLLVYSTCSIEPEENQARVAAFLSRHPDFVAEAPPPAAEVPPECLTEEGYLQMLPHVHGTDGAFAARLRRARGG